MKAFLEDIMNLTGLDASLMFDGYRIVNFSSKAVYVEGMRNILSFSSTQVLLKLKKGVVKIEGEGLVIKEIMYGTALVRGVILKVEVS